MSRSLLIFATVIFVASGSDEPAAVRPVDIDGCENAFLVAPGVFSGGEPHDEAAFDALASAGVKTIISVDGAIPDAAAARTRGMRYVHIPIGYDDVPEQTGYVLGKALETLEGPIYIHCHHGKHRGPAAVAVALRVARAWPLEAAVVYLKAAETSPKYAGLFEAVRRAARPPEAMWAAFSPDFPERAEVTSLAAAMAQLDRRADHLALLQANHWQPDPAHPDLAPLSEAVQVRELFAELLRKEAAGDWPEAFISLLRASHAATVELEAALDVCDAAQADSAFATLTRQCSACHSGYRNQGR